SWLRRKSFRVRLSALVAAAVGVTLALAAVASYIAVRHQLYSQVDSSLQKELGAAPSLLTAPGPPNTRRVASFLSQFNNSILQFVSADGTVEFSSTGPRPPLPVNPADSHLALADTQTDALRTITSHGANYRVATLGGGLADANGNPLVIQIARPL